MSIEKRRVFIVEDEPLIAMMLEEMLDELGFVVAGTAARLADGVEKAAALQVDFAVLDLNLGGQKATPIAEMLKSRNIPFIVASGEGAAGIPAELKGAVVLDKPFSQVSLSAAVAQLD